VGKLANLIKRNIKQISSGGWLDSETRIAFVHVPKCGGTSLKLAIRNTFNPLAQIPGVKSAYLSHDSAHVASEVLGEDYRDYCENLLPYFLANNRYRFVSGHWGLRDSVYHRFHESWDFILLLRNPENRFLSNYWFNRVKADEHFRIQSDLNEFLKSDRATNYGRAFLRYLVPDSFRWNDAPSDELVEQACENLGRFKVVFALEDLTAAKMSFKKAYGVTLNIPHVNTTRALGKDRPEKPSSDQLDQIREICRPDMAIYQAAIERIASENNTLET